MNLPQFINSMVEGHKVCSQFKNIIEKDVFQFKNIMNGLEEDVSELPAEHSCSLGPSPQGHIPWFFPPSTGPVNRQQHPHPPPPRLTNHPLQYQLPLELQAPPVLIEERDGWTAM